MRNSPSEFDKDLLKMIFRLLPIKDFYSLFSVNKHWSQVATALLSEEQGRFKLCWNDNGVELLKPKEIPFLTRELFFLKQFSSYFPIQFRRLAQAQFTDSWSAKFQKAIDDAPDDKTSSKDPSQTEKASPPENELFLSIVESNIEAFEKVMSRIKKEKKVTLSSLIADIVDLSFVENIFAREIFFPKEREVFENIRRKIWSQLLEEETDANELLFLGLMTFQPIERLEEIIDNGADVNHAFSINEKELKPLEICYFYGDLKRADFFIEKGATPEKDEAVAEIAALYGHVPLLRRVVEKNPACLKIAIPEHGPLMHASCYYGHVGTLKYLLIDCKQDIETVDKDNWTILHASSQADSGLEITEFLLEQNTNIRALNNLNLTPLQHASGRKTQKLLLDKSLEKTLQEPEKKSEWTSYWQELKVINFYQRIIKEIYNNKPNRLLLFAILTKQPEAEINSLLDSVSSNLLAEPMELANNFYPTIVPHLQAKIDLTSASQPMRPRTPC